MLLVKSFMEISNMPFSPPLTPSPYKKETYTRKNKAFKIKSKLFIRAVNKKTKLKYILVVNE